jgi:hypothetical protein
MPDTELQAPAKAAPKLSLDTWAVLLALAAAVLIRLGLLPHIPW